MARPKADAVKVAAAVAAVRTGTPLAAAAAAQGIGLSTLKRELKTIRGGSTGKPASSSPAPPSSSSSPARASSSPASSSSSPALATSIDVTIAAALADLGDDPDAAVIGASLTELGSKIAGLDPAKLPAAMNQLRGLVRDLRALRPQRPPSPDQIDERLRDLDARALRKIERYLDEADRVRRKRLDALKAWGAEHLSAELADELATLADGLDAPIVTPPTHGTA